MLEIPFTVQNGKPPTSVLISVLDAASRMDGKKLVLTLKEYKRKRSSKQNQYYWGVVVEEVRKMFIEHGTQTTPDEVHDFLKLRVGKLAQNIILPDGEVVKSLGSTAKLKTQEFEAYLEQIRAWAAEYGLIIPLPNEG